MPPATWQRAANLLRTASETPIQWTAWAPDSDQPRHASSLAIVVAVGNVAAVVVVAVVVVAVVVANVVSNVAVASLSMPSFFASNLPKLFIYLRFSIGYLQGSFN